VQERRGAIDKDPDVGQYSSVSDTTDTDAQGVRDWLLEKGWEVRAEERDLHQTFHEASQLYLPSFNHTHWADLVSLQNPDFVVPNYGSGMTEAEAVMRAKARYGSEHA
jgi:hypothetical protein